jgi:hypothetical protein
LDSCAVCGLKIVDVSNGLCSIHSESYRNVTDAYSRWSVAYDHIAREDFLKRLATRPETGFRAKETAEFLIKNPERWK